MNSNSLNTSVLLFADGYVGESITEWMIDNFKSDIAGVVTRDENTLLSLANNASLCCHVYKSEDEFKSFLKAEEIIPDLGILCWWPKIITKDIISVAKNGFINTHPSLLPFNRGKNYNFWALVDQTPFGVTIHQVDLGIDTGPILFQEQIFYDWLDTGESLFYKAQKAMISLFTRCYPNIRSLNYKAIPQDNAMSTMHFQSDMINASKLNLDEKISIRQILNLLRARSFKGYPACSFEENGVEYEVRINVSKK